MLKDSFCSSPWFHIRLTYDGSFELCRWAKGYKTNYNIQNTSIRQFYNSDVMNKFRQDLLNGQQPKSCKVCYYEESFGKLNGRKRQLLKSAVTLDDFEIKMRASPHYNFFKYSNDNQGQANYEPVDIQIDLGNICNSGCIMCNPQASSRLHHDFMKLNQIEPSIFKRPNHYTSWTADPAVLNRVVDELSSFSNLKYIHFLGGETLYDPAFYQICDRIIAAGFAANIIVGTTTNATIYNEKIATYAKAFKEFHLGISIESVTDLNDYIRWPSKINEVLATINQFKQLHDTTNLFISLRITPNIFTISCIDQLIRYMLDNNLIAESCNILHNPSCLRIELMPENIRNQIIQKLEYIIDEYQLTKTNIVNARSRDNTDKVIADLTLDYLNFLKTYEIPTNAEEDKHNLVKFLKAFEQVRGNKITDYAPEYSEFLRAYGY
jgi:MoaA/NifB/PqqE/SkfB family radical SAM enzyme